MVTDPSTDTEKALIAEIHGIDTQIEKKQGEIRHLVNERRSKEQELVKLYTQRATAGGEQGRLPNPTPRTVEEQIQNIAYLYLMKADFCATKQILLAAEKQGIAIAGPKPGNVVSGALQKRKDVFSYKDEIWSLV
jgi:hypothetical protein